jgi:hypothetical protein
MWSGFATSRAAAPINGGGSDRRQAAPRFLGFFLRQAPLQGGNQVDNIAAGALGRRRLAFLSLRLVSISFFG